MKLTKRGRREPLLPIGNQGEPPADLVSLEPVSAPPEPTSDGGRGLFTTVHGEIHRGALAQASDDGPIHQGPLEPSWSGDIHPGPLDHSPDGAIHIGPLERSARLGEPGIPRPDDALPEVRIEPLAEEGSATAAFETPLVAEVQNAPSLATVVIAKRKKSWREQRWERRRRRIYFEEALAWVLVPIILIACYLGVKGVLAAFGTSPTALIQGIQTAISSRS